MVKGPKATTDYSLEEVYHMVRRHALFFRKHFFKKNCLTCLSSQNKAVIDVDEGGVEAAGATEVGVTSKLGFTRVVKINRYPEN